ncbi:MAG: hypothetical protein K0M40_09830 [Prolixibacteraceae bacterium]|nr:hypothetical protein [Prolixibacteraceae bacterium]
MKNRNSILSIFVTLNSILLIITIFVGCQSSTRAVNDVKPLKSYSIVMFGNSLTAGGKWSNDLNRLDIKNSGTGGFTTSHFVWILKGEVIKYNPKICFIEGGINDIGVGIPSNRTFRNYKSIVDTLLKYQIEPVLQSTFYVNLPNDSVTKFYNSRVDSLNKYISTLANENGITYLDLNQHLSENGKLKKELNKDGIHLNELGYKIWIREIDKFLKQKGI